MSLCIDPSTCTRDAHLFIIGRVDDSVTAPPTGVVAAGQLPATLPTAAVVPYLAAGELGHLQKTPSCINNNKS